MMTTTKPQAKVTSGQSISSIWILPLIAIIIGAWMLYHQWSTQGPLITIQFSSAEGIEVGKTKIKARNVDIGKVEQVTLNSNFNSVTVTARIDKNAEKLLVEDSNFWIVSPKISVREISGLNTLLSGGYIEASPGESEIPQNHFVALEEAPVTPFGTPGLHITLNSNDQFAYSVGDPILYKGLSVGKFEDIYFNFDERIVYYNAFINAPYHKLITENTKFWDISGFKLDLNADGVTVKTGNIETMLTNGVTFGVPQGIELGEVITERGYFNIYANYEAASDQRYKHTLEYVVLVSDTIRGLNVGAPVEYRGVTVGHVLSTHHTAPTYQGVLDQDYKIPVLIGLQPGRVGLQDDETGVSILKAQIIKWVKQGLKATLSTGSLLTGSLFVELQHYEHHPEQSILHHNEYLVIPTVNDEFTQLADKVSSFLDSLNSVDIASLGQHSNELIVELKQTALMMQQLSQNMNGLLTKAHDTELIEQLQQTIVNIGQMSKGYSSGSENYQQLNSTLKGLESLMHEIKPLVIQLNSQPNSLIFNGGKEQEIAPKKYQGDK